MDARAVEVALPLPLQSTFTYRVPEKKRVARSEIDPRHVLPDVDRANNVWPRGK